MARKAQENPQLDMTPMIDVVFELIIFFVVTLKMHTAKDESIKLADGRNGIELTPDELPPSNMIVDVAKSGRISMCNITLTANELGQRIREHRRRFGEFPVLIRADEKTPHSKIAQVMEACTANGVWKLSFIAIYKGKNDPS